MVVTKYLAGIFSKYVIPFPDHYNCIAISLCTHYVYILLLTFVASFLLIEFNAQQFASFICKEAISFLQNAITPVLLCS